MPRHITLPAAITIFFISTIIFSFVYGPMQRSYVSPPKVLSVDSVAELAQAWEASGIKGRIAINFTRYLNAFELKDSKEVRVIELSMSQGVVRKVFHVAPDVAWTEISEVLSKRKDVRRTQEGFTWVFAHGRVHIMPFSRFSAVEEKALVVIEPRVWTVDELEQIAAKVKSGKIRSDVVVIIRGSEKDAELFRAAMIHEMIGAP